jgi:hypothetical protein
MPETLLQPLEPVEPPDGHDCEEGLGEDELIRELTAEARGWGPGWPSDNSSRMAVARGGGVAIQVRAELVPLVERLLDETVRRGYPLRHGECWGFANRPIRGTRRPSNHSWGLALDLNASTNPMQATLQTDMPTWMVELWTGQMFRWGGAYRTRKDPMHFEFMGSPADAARLGPGGTPAQASDGQPVLRRGATGPAVTRLQERLNAHGTAPALVVDGVFGPATDAAVRAFQQQNGLAVDGIVGPRTWAALG